MQNQRDSAQRMQSNRSNQSKPSVVLDVLGKRAAAPNTSRTTRTCSIFLTHENRVEKPRGAGVDKSSIYQLPIGNAENIHPPDDSFKVVLSGTRESKGLNCSFGGRGGIMRQQLRLFYKKVWPRIPLQFLIFFSYYRAAQQRLACDPIPIRNWVLFIHDGASSKTSFPPLISSVMHLKIRPLNAISRWCEPGA